MDIQSTSIPVAHRSPVLLAGGAATASAATRSRYCRATAGGGQRLGAAASAFVRSAVVRAGDYLTLMKPRVMSLVVFTAAVGLLSAPGGVKPATGLLAILFIAAGAGAAAILNMWYDADIDAVMARTSDRPIPQGRVRPGEALALGLALAAAAVALLGWSSNVAAAALLAVTIGVYILVYTVWLKRASPHNIVIGGVAGAFPPMIGWAAATGAVSLESLLLVLIIFLWTPPHFWALSLYRTDDYARAAVPMLPVVAGAARTSEQIFVYTLLLVLVSLLPCALGFAGPVYGAVAATAGGHMLLLAWRLRVACGAAKRIARRLFTFSIAYLFSLFAAYLTGKLLAAHFAN